MSLKIDRLNNLIQREVSLILEREVKDKGIDFVTVTAVRTSSDLSFCRIYVTCLNDEKRNETMQSLKNASGFIRKELASRIEVRHVPVLEFVYDESIEYGQRIEEKIKEIYNEN